MTLSTSVSFNDYSNAVIEYLLNDPQHKFVTNLFFFFLKQIKQFLENGFPGDMALTPGEALQLYDVMVKQWPDKESMQVSGQFIRRKSYNS